MKSLAIVLLCIAAAVGYGILHDQITARICVDYFTIGHPPIFGTEDPTLLGLGWGVIATWWVGAFMGVPLAVAARAGGRPRREPHSLVRPLALLMGVSAIVAALAGLGGYYLASIREIWLVPELAEQMPPQTQVKFLAVGAAHSASYNCGFFGDLVLIVGVWRSRRSRAPKSLDAIGKVICPPPKLPIGENPPAVSIRDLLLLAAGVGLVIPASPFYLVFSHYRDSPNPYDLPPPYYLQLGLLFGEMIVEGTAVGICLHLARRWWRNEMLPAELGSYCFLLTLAWYIYNSAIAYYAISFVVSLLPWDGARDWWFEFQTRNQSSIGLQLLLTAISCMTGPLIITWSLALLRQRTPNLWRWVFCIAAIPWLLTFVRGAWLTPPMNYSRESLTRCLIGLLIGTQVLSFAACTLAIYFDPRARLGKDWLLFVSASVWATHCGLAAMLSGLHLIMRFWY